MAVGTEFIFHMVELARFLVGLLWNSESQGGGKQNSWEWTERPVIDSTLAKTSEEGFKEYDLFCYSWNLSSWRRVTVTDGRSEDNTSNDPFSRCTTSNHYGYSLNWRWRNKFGLQLQEETRNYVSVVKSNYETSDTNDDVTIKTTKCTWNRTRDKWVCT